MRRSKRITLVALATVSCMALTACDDSQNKDTEVIGDMYNSVQECKEAHDPSDPSKLLYTEDECKTQFAKAMADHKEHAPKFSSLKDCEDQFGPGACGNTDAQSVDSPTTPPSSSNTTIINNTTTHESSGGSFMPFMAGMLMGHALTPPTPVYYGPGSWKDPNRDNRPFYSSGGSFYNSNSSSKPLGYLEKDVGGYSQTIATPSNKTGGRPSANAINRSLESNGFSPGKYSSKSSAFGSPATRSYSPPPSSIGSSRGFGSMASRGSSVSSRGGFGGMSAGHSSGGFGG